MEKAEAAKINVEKLEIKDIDFSLLGNKEELLLLQKLFRFPEEVELAATNSNPSRLVNHVYETAKTFNQFYNRHLVISIKNGELTKARLALVEAAGIVLKRGLNLLGIEVMEEM